MPLQAQRFGLHVGAALQVFQRLEREVEKIPAAAGRVEYAEIAQAFEMSMKQRGGVFVGFVAVFFRLGEQLGDLLFGGLPFGGERADDDRLDQPLNRRRVGVMRTELGTLGGVEAAFEQGTEDRRVDIAPIHAGGVMQRDNVCAGERRHGDRDLPV